MNTLEIEARIRNVYLQQITEPRGTGSPLRIGPIVALSDLRAAMPDVPREIMDTALSRLADHCDVYITPSGWIAHKNMPEADRAAALWLGATHAHTITIHAGYRTPGRVVERLRMRDRDHATSMVAALDDDELDAVAAEMGVEAAPGGPQATRQRLADTSVANHDAWFRDAQQGYEDGKLLYRADTNPEWAASWTDTDRQAVAEALARLQQRASTEPEWAYLQQRLNRIKATLESGCRPSC